MHPGSVYGKVATVASVFGDDAEKLAVSVTLNLVASFPSLALCLHEGYVQE